MKMKKIALVKKITPGERIPKYYGVSWRECNTHYTICHPFPFNIIIGIVRRAWLRMRFYYKSGMFDEIYISGLHEGIDLGKKEFFRQIMVVFNVPYEKQEIIWDDIQKAGSAEPIQRGLWKSFMIEYARQSRILEKERDERYEKNSPD